MCDPLAIPAGIESHRADLRFPSCTAVRGYPALTRMLIEEGVDIHRENMYGCSAQRIAEINQKENPGCWDAAEAIAEAGGYDAGWPGVYCCQTERGERGRRVK